MMSRIRYLQIKLDGEKWERLNDMATYKNTTDDSTIKEVYAGKKPEFIIFNSSIFILSGEDISYVEDGLKLWSIIYPKDFTDLSLTEDMSTPPDDYSFPISFRELDIHYKSTGQYF